MTFTTQTYPAYCPVCGRLYDHHSEFVSAHMNYAQDGVGRITRACDHHTGDEVKRAWAAARGSA